MADKVEKNFQIEENRDDSEQNELTNDISTKLTLRKLKDGDPFAWAPIAATEEISPESQTVSHFFFVNF